MKFLSSDFPPLMLGHQSLGKEFANQLAKSDSINIAVGYVSERSLEYLVECIHGSKFPPNCNLAIGMHHFEKFTRSQYVAAKHAEDFLRDASLGSVKLVTSFPFHGKLYSFRCRDSGGLTSIIGSSNLNNIRVHNPIRQYECDLLVTDALINRQIGEFIDSLLKVSTDLNDVPIEHEDFKEIDNLLEGLHGVEKVARDTCVNVRNSISGRQSFDIPLKAYESAPQSNLNVFFGKGRENTHNTMIVKRHWYEVEIIVPKTIADMPQYPKVDGSGGENVITVITDDGYKFDCKISGTNSKNFRSTSDLTILGRWVKGRLERAGFLSIGSKVTEDVLKRYGRDTITLSATDKEDLWFLDFSI